jgi:hypothetical protein
VGGTAFYSHNATPISNLGGYPGTLVLETGALPTGGIYYFSAAAYVSVDLHDLAVKCYVSFGNRGAMSDGDEGGVENPFTNPVELTLEGNAAVVDYWDVSAGDTGQLYCYSTGDDSASEFIDGGLTVTLISSSAFGTAALPANGADINNRAEAKPRVRPRKQ